LKGEKEEQGNMEIIDKKVPFFLSSPVGVDKLS